MSSTFSERNRSANSASLQRLESRRATAARIGSATPLIIFGVIALALLGTAGAYFFSGSSDVDSISPIMASVTKGEFVSQVLDQGEIQSSENVEIRCEVRARNGQMTVLTVVTEGSRVKEGDFLVQLDSTSFEKELEQQKIAIANAETSVIQAEAALDTAKATLKEYEQGTFVQNQKTIQNEIFDAESQITTAQQELKRANDTYNHSTKLFAKNYITRDTLEADKFEVKRAEIGVKRGENSLELAKQKMEVLKDITYEKETVQLNSDIKAATVKLASEKESQSVEKEKLAEIEAMIAKCTIKVPEGVSGQVVFAKESSRGGNDWVLEEGTSVRENQVLIRLPNPDKMEVKALINEQSITQIRPNMPASIKVDALNSTTLKGVVTKVNQYAESSGWMSSSVRKYAVFVRIIDPPEALKPGMNSSVAIQVQYEDDALLAPLQTIYGVQDRQFCLAKRGENKWETLEVEIAGDNSQMVLIETGVEEGTELVMNPGAFKEYMDLPELELDAKIEIPDGELATAVPADGPSDSATGKGGGAKGGMGKSGGGKPGQAGGRPGGGQAGRGGGGGMGGFSMPASGAALIKSKDTDGDGKLTKDEAGSPYSYFFDRVDTDGDGFLSEAEADASIQSMKKRMQGGGGGRGGPGGGGRG
jgi:multidrug resistance efflux pump